MLLYFYGMKIFTEHFSYPLGTLISIWSQILVKTWSRCCNIIWNSVWTDISSSDNWVKIGSYATEIGLIMYMLTNMFDAQFTSNQFQFQINSCQAFDVSSIVFSISIADCDWVLNCPIIVILGFCAFFILAMAFMTKVWVMPLKLFTKLHTFQNRILCFIGFEGRKRTILFFFYINTFCISLNLIREAILTLHVFERLAT